MCPSYTIPNILKKPAIAITNPIILTTKICISLNSSFKSFVIYLTPYTMIEPTTTRIILKVSKESPPKKLLIKDENCRIE